MEAKDTCILFNVRKLLLLNLFLIYSTSPLAAQKNFTLEEIWGGKFTMQYLYGYEMTSPHHLLRGEFKHGTYSINLYDLDGWKLQKTIFSTRNHPEFRYVADYVFSSDLNFFLLASDVRPIYRYSKKGKYYLYDVKQDKLTPFSENYIQIPQFTPDGKKVVYFKENNLYYKDLSSGKVSAVTSDGKKNQIINGKTDWVYEEEFSFVQAYALSKSGRYLAYLKFDESRVPEYQLSFYADKLYPERYTYKYPKAGEQNSKVSLHIYDFETSRTRTVVLGTYEYIPYIRTGKKENEFLVMTLNRHQNDLKLYSVNAPGATAEIIATQKSDTYVDVENLKKIEWVNDNEFFWLSEADGYRHIYKFTRGKNTPEQITKGKWEVTEFYGYDSNSGRLYYQSTENGSINRTLYAVDDKGKNKIRLSPGEGTSSADFSKDYRFFILTYSNAETPYQYVLYKTPEKGKKTAEKLKTVIDNKTLMKKLGNYHLIQKEFLTFRSADGAYELDAYLYRPLHFDRSKKYPVLIYQYNGPGVKTVQNAWGYYNEYYHQMLAQEGYIVVSVDTRGTGGKGAQFRQATYKKLGRLELEDLTAVAKEIKSWKYVDKVGIWGWSYGGFMAANAILQSGDVFDMAIAVAPVTNWRYYDTVYTERYMQTPRENPDGYDNNSPLTYASYLQKPFLLIHGTADDNVHVQNTYELARKLQEAGKSFDMEIYPDKNHGIYGGKTRYQLYKKMYEFLNDNLKNKSL